MIIAIDNGMSGGICAISKHSGSIIATQKMPIRYRHGSNEVDVLEFMEILGIMSPTCLFKPEIVIEKPGGSKSATAAKSMSGCMHAIRGALESRGLTLHRITPQSWQKVLIPGKGDTKERALAKAKELWPDEKWLNLNKTEKSYRPHDGVIDAALIAYYWKQQLDASENSG